MPEEKLKKTIPKGETLKLTYTAISGKQFIVTQDMLKVFYLYEVHPMGYKKILSSQFYNKVDEKISSLTKSETKSKKRKDDADGI